MYYVIKVKTYKCFKPDLIFIEEVNDLNKAIALRDALRGIHPDERYEVITEVTAGK